MTELLDVRRPETFRSRFQTALNNVRAVLLCTQSGQLPDEALINRNAFFAPPLGDDLCDCVVTISILAQLNRLAPDPFQNLSTQLSVFHSFNEDFDNTKTVFVYAQVTNLLSDFRVHKLDLVRQKCIALQYLLHHMSALLIH